MLFLRNNKKSIIFISLFLGVGVLRLVLEQALSLPYGCAITFSYILTYILWIRYNHRRFPQKQVRRRILFIGVLLIFFQMLRLVKLEFSAHDSVFERYLWYSYYIPIILLPVINLETLFYCALPDKASPPRARAVLWAASGIMIALVFTNDLHDLAFRLPEDMREFEKNYTHGPLFKVITAFIVVMIICIFAYAVKLCVNRRLYRNLWLPVLVAALGLFYRLTYSFYGGDKNVLQKMYEIPELYGVVWISLWESIIAARLLPSNRGYNELLSESSLMCWLTDRELCVKQNFYGSAMPEKELLSAAADSGTVVSPDGKALLRARGVRGGWFFWTKDLSALKKLEEELEETADYLIEENTMLNQAAEIESSLLASERKTELYNTVENRLRPKTEKLERLLASPAEDEADFRRMLRKAAVLFTYCKRLSYLTLLSAQNSRLPSSELSVCIEESANHLKNVGCRCSFDIAPFLSLPGETALGLYELFEEAAENVIEDGSPSFLTVTLGQSGEEGSFEFKIDAPSDRKSAFNGEVAEKARGIGETSLEKGENTCSLLIKKEGGTL